MKKFMRMDVKNIFLKLGLLPVMKKALGGIACSLSVASVCNAVSENAPERPNFLWLTSEDNDVSWIGCYGNPKAETPNIDRLAAEGFRYTHAFANAPVCAPSRSSWITGLQALSMGTHPMRSRYPIPHDRIRYYPDYLREAGYFCANGFPEPGGYSKTDYNIGGREDVECWNQSAQVNWEALKTKQPFFQVVNYMESHESRAHGDVENTEYDPGRVSLCRYHPDISDIRKNYAKYYDAIKKMDAKIGEALASLERAGLAEDTIVIYCSDHGGVMPRSKRFLFDCGQHSPLVVRIPEKWRNWWPAKTPGVEIERLVSFVDMPKTWLSLAGAEVPPIMQGRIFLGSSSEKEPEYHFAFRGRMDERAANERAVRDKRFLYIKNYMPYAPRGQYSEYMWKMKAVQVWHDAYLGNETDEIQSRFFRPAGTYEELYDCIKDPDNIRNLAGDPAYANKLSDMQGALRVWQEEIFDTGLLPEADLARLADQAGLTIYEFVRRPDLYSLSDYLNASDIALEHKPESLGILRQMLSSKDCGLRYWGVTGCLLLNSGDSETLGLIRNLLQDNSHEIRALAAWILVQHGDEAGYQTLNDMLYSGSYATGSILNIIDWMGDAARPLVPALASLPESGLRNYLLFRLQKEVSN